MKRMYCCFSRKRELFKGFFNSSSKIIREEERERGLSVSRFIPRICFIRLADRYIERSVIRDERDEQPRIAKRIMENYILGEGREERYSL